MMDYIIAILLLFILLNTSGSEGLLRKILKEMKKQ